MDDLIFTIPSFGTVARIGDIYDYRSGKFKDTNIFSKALPESLIATELQNSIKYDFLFSNNFFDKAEKFDMKPEVSVEIFLDSSEVSRAGIYLKEKTLKVDSVHASFIQKIRTCEEMIDFKNVLLQPYFKDNIGNEGTHVVGCITHGTIGIISMTYDNIEDTSVDVIHAYFETSIRELLGSKNENDNQMNLMIKEDLEMLPVSKAESTEKEVVIEMGIENNKVIDLIDKPTPATINPKNIKIKLYTDVFGMHEISVNSLREAVEILYQLPKHESPDKSQKGTHLQYHLLPISMLKNQALISIDEDFNKLEDKLINKLIIFFKEIEQIETELSELKNILDMYKKNFSDDEREKIYKTVEKFLKNIDELKNCLKEKIQEYKEGNAESVEIEALKISFDMMRHKKIKEFLKSFKYVKEKVSFLKTMANRRISVLVEDAELDAFKRQNRNQKILVLFFDFKAHKDASNWNETLEFFLNEHTYKTSSKNQFLCFDMATLKREIYNQDLRICQIFNGRVVSYDVMKENLKKSCYVKCDKEFERITEINPKRLPIDIRCPGTYGNSLQSCLCDHTAKEWYCVNCQVPIEYGFNNKFYCYCGQQNIEHYGFKCNDEKHDYMKFDVRLLLNLLEEMRKKKEINILLIGESGAGKSTWLNLIPYYLNCESLDEAQDKDITKMNLIPLKFIKYGEEKQSVSIGSSSNENSKETQSATQYPRSYTFKHNCNIYRFIDTPGICDTRGTKQDQANLQYITDYVVKFDTIHAICIFFKFDQTRLTEKFEYCFQELLSQLHISAAKNIQFFFTFSNSRPYTRASTLNSLEELLCKLNTEKKLEIKLTDRCYSFDNESYKYLCSINHKIKYSPEAINDYGKCYLQSRLIFLQFLNNITEVSPYQTKSCISISYSRKLIMNSIVSLTLLKTSLSALIRQLRYTYRKNLAAGSLGVGILSFFSFVLTPAVAATIILDVILFGTFVASVSSSIVGAVGSLISLAELMSSEKMKGWKIVKNRACCKKCIEKQVFIGRERFQFLEVDPNAIDVEEYVLEVYRDLQTTSGISRFFQNKDVEEEICESADEVKSVDEAKKIIKGNHYCVKCGENYEYCFVPESIVELSPEEIEKRQTKNRDFKQIEEDLNDQDKTIQRAIAEFAVFLQKFTLTTYEDLAEITLKKTFDEENDPDIKKELETHLDSYIEARQEILRDYDATDIDARLNDINKTIERLMNLKDVGLIIRILITRSDQGKLCKKEEEQKNNNEPNEIHFFLENI